MALDYREPRFVNKNKPRRSPFGFMALLISGMVLIVFALGFVSGWLASLYRIKKSSPPQVAATPPTPAATGDNPPPLPAAPLNRKGEVPLTFYKTLPEGGNVVIGSGLNPRKAEQQPATPHALPAAPNPAAPSQPPQPKPVVPQPQAAPSPAATPAAPVPKTQPVTKPQPVTKTQPVTKAPAAATVPAPASAADKTVPSRSVGTDKEKRFTVQVASVRDKKEAEAMRDKLEAKGFKPSIVEVRSPEKGLLYRIRAGRSLQKKEAQAVAEKLGSGAIVIPE